MATITNHSRAVRVLNATVDGKVRSVAIEPGASVEADPVKTKGFAAAVEAGYLSVKTAVPEKPAASAKPDQKPSSKD